jgi:hypothetical protein
MVEPGFPEGIPVDASQHEVRELTARHHHPVGAHGDSNSIGSIDETKNRLKLVVTIRPAADDVQEKIELRRCREEFRITHGAASSTLGECQRASSRRPASIALPSIPTLRVWALAGWLTAPPARDRSSA